MKASTAFKGLIISFFLLVLLAFSLLFFSGYLLSKCSTEYLEMDITPLDTISEIEYAEEYIELVLTYSIALTKEGEEFAWNLVRNPDSLDYTLDYALKLVRTNDSLFIEKYQKYFIKDD